MPPIALHAGWTAAKWAHFQKLHRLNPKKYPKPDPHKPPAGIHRGKDEWRTDPHRNKPEDVKDPADRVPPREPPAEPPKDPPVATSGSSPEPNPHMPKDAAEMTAWFESKIKDEKQPGEIVPQRIQASEMGPKNPDFRGRPFQEHMSRELWSMYDTFLGEKKLDIDVDHLPVDAKIAEKQMRDIFPGWTKENFMAWFESTHNLRIWDKPGPHLKRANKTKQNAGANITGSATRMSSRAGSVHQGLDPTRPWWDNENLLNYISAQIIGGTGGFARPAGSHQNRITLHEAEFITATIKKETRIWLKIEEGIHELGKQGKFEWYKKEGDGRWSMDEQSFYTALTQDLPRESRLGIIATKNYSPVAAGYWKALNKVVEKRNREIGLEGWPEHWSVGLGTVKGPTVKGPDGPRSAGPMPFLIQGKKSGPPESGPGTGPGTGPADPN
jgi:hypothetical protein